MASESSKPTTRQKNSPRDYTIALQLENQLVVIIGGGSVARRKLPGLLATGARIRIIDPAPASELPQHPQLTHLKREYQLQDLTSARLIFAATDNPQINQQVAREAATLGILCCRVDNAEDSDFTTPACLLRPPLTISVSSSGTSPAMAAALRDKLDEMIPASWQTATRLVAAIRQKVLTESRQIPYNQQVLLQLIDQGLLALIERSDVKALDLLLCKHFGAGFALKDLSFSLPETDQTRNFGIPEGTP